MLGLESDLDLVLFGPPRALHAGDPLHFERHKTLALLAYLAVTGRPHGRDSLALLFWPEADAVQGRSGLRRALSELRQVFGPGILETSEGCVALASGALRVDVLQFRDHLARVTAHAHGEGALCPACLTALREAVELAHGDFLAGFSLRETEEFDAWQTLTTETLRLELSAALERLATALAERQEYAAALPYARRWLTLDPLHEPAHRLLMRLYAATGDRPAAVRQYEQCVQILADELGISPDLETGRLHAALFTGPQAQEPVAVPVHNLPPDVTPFIGREAQLAQVAARLADPACHLLTVLGSGGIGKTRLAIEASRRAVGHFPQGVWFVDLAPLTTAEQLAGTILGTLGLVEHGAGGTDARLLEYLADRRMLLVLDNYEHLLSGQEVDRRDGYGLVMQLVGAAPGVKLLVTSRARLNVAAEWLEPLEGLAVPLQPPEGAVQRRLSREATLAVLEQYSATHLFVTAVRRLRPDFAPTPDEGHTIAHICRLLRGVPLAIEMAAAWTRALALAEIARRIEQGLEILTTTARGVPERQRSMAATFDYSWRLLAPRERSILRQLAVFRGGFTAEAAEAVTRAGLGELAALVDASWLRLGEGGRYGVHELIRQYCAEKLAQEHAAEMGEDPDTVRARHSRYFQPLIMDRWTDFWRRPGTVREILPDLANLMAAWEWTVTAGDLPGVWPLRLGLLFLGATQGAPAAVTAALEAGLCRLREHARVHHDDPDWTVAVALIETSVCEMWVHDGRMADTDAGLDEAARLLGDHDKGAAHWAEARYFNRRIRAQWLYYLGEYDRSARIFNELRADIHDGLILPPYTPDGTHVWHVETCWGVVQSLLAAGDYDEALRYIAEGIAEAEQANLKLLWAYAARLQIPVLLQIGNYAQAEQASRRLFAAATEFDHKQMIGFALTLLGQTHLALGRPDRALACFHRNLELGRHWDRDVGNGYTLCLLGHAEIALGDLALAERHFRRACEASWLPGGLYGLARLALARGDPAAARELCRQVLTGQGLWAWLKGQTLMQFAEATAQLGEPEYAAELCGFLLAWRGTRFAERQDATQLLAELTDRMPAADLAAATARGRAREPADIVAEVVGPVGQPV